MAWTTRVTIIRAAVCISPILTKKKGSLKLPGFGRVTFSRGLLYVVFHKVVDPRLTRRAERGSFQVSSTSNVVPCFDGTVLHVHAGIVAANTSGDYFWNWNARAGQPSSRPRLQGVRHTENYGESGTRGISQRSWVSRATGRSPSDSLGLLIEVPSLLSFTTRLLSYM